MKKETRHEQYKNELKSLRDKANSLASIHSKLSDEYNGAHTWVASILLVVSTLLVGMTFVSEDFIFTSIGFSPNVLKWIIGITSILNFAGVLLLAEWKFQERATSHREAVRFYFGIVNRIREILDSGETITEERIKEMRSEYVRTGALPKIPDSKFLPLKQWHLQKVAVSRELDKNPFEPIKKIQKRLKEVKKL